MKTIVACIMSLFLYGCACQPEKIVIETKYVVTEIPDDHLDIPSQVLPIDLKQVSQKGVSDWLLRNEERTVVLENNLKAIRQLQSDFKKMYDTE